MSAHPVPLLLPHGHGIKVSWLRKVILAKKRGENCTVSGVRSLGFQVHAPRDVGQRPRDLSTR